MSEDDNSNTFLGGYLNKSNIVSWILVIILVAPFLVYGFPQLIGAEDALIVRSGSMEPAIQTGSVVFVYSKPAENIETGDVITFETDSLPDESIRYTTHRVVDRDAANGEISFKTKGDANDNPDQGTVPAEDVLGTVEFSIPYIGYILAELDTPMAIILLVMIPAALLILNELWSITKEVSDLKRQGRDLELVGTVSVFVAIIIFAVSAVMSMDILPELLPEMSDKIQFGPTTFGGIIMVSIIFSMLMLKLV